MMLKIDRNAIGRFGITRKRSTIRCTTPSGSAGQHHFRSLNQRRVILEVTRATRRRVVR